MQHRTSLQLINLSLCWFLVVGSFFGSYCVVSSFHIPLSSTTTAYVQNFHTASSRVLKMSSDTKTDSSSPKGRWIREKGDPHVETVLFVECGFGNDSHGQNSTKAAIRACRNAIEFNSIPSVQRLVPNGYDGLKLDVLLAVPPKYQDSLDLNKVQEVFPYGSIRFQIQDGGMIAPSGIAIERLGDKNEDMVVVCASVTVGY
jgi:uncharacterized protein (TIGR02058 family)